MQSSIFVRPNLKGFIIAAAFVVMFHCIMQQIEGITTDGGRPKVPSSVKHWGASDFEAMLNYACDRPSSETYYKLSSYLEQQRDYKRAMIFIKKAEAYDQADEESQ